MSDTVKEAGKRNSAADMAKLATIHDAVVGMGYECPGTAASTSGGPWGWESKREALDAVIDLLEKTPRIGADKDKPEGARYIQVSETLADQILEKLKGPANQEISEVTETALCQ